MAHFDINRCFNSPYNWSFSPVTPVSSINKTVHRDIIEILLKVALNTITLTSREASDAGEFHLKTKSGDFRVIFDEK